MSRNSSKRYGDKYIETSTEDENSCVGRGGIALSFADRYPRFLHTLVTQDIATPVKVAPASPLDCPVYCIVTSFAAQGAAVVGSQRINLAHSFFSSWDAKSAVFLTVARRGFEVDQISLKLVTFDCLCFSLKGSYFAPVSVAYANLCGIVIFLLENGSHLAEFWNSLPASFQTTRTGNSHTFTFGLPTVKYYLKMN